MADKPTWDKAIDEIPYKDLGMSDQDWMKILRNVEAKAYNVGYKRALDAIRQRAGQPGDEDMDDSCIFCPLIQVRVDHDGEADTSCTQDPCPLEMVVQEIVQSRKEADEARIQKFADDYVRAGKEKRSDSHD